MNPKHQLRLEGWNDNQNITLTSGDSVTLVGSRMAPIAILYLFSLLAVIVETVGCKIRSGRATGIDGACEDALLNPESSAEIYIPNEKFPKNMGAKRQPYHLIPKEMFGTSFTGLYRQATQLIHQYKLHPAWQALDNDTLDLHNRNIFQVLGKDLNSPSNACICYTPNGEQNQRQTSINTGGTATAINTADRWCVPLLNLGNESDLLSILTFISLVLSNNKPDIPWKHVPNMRPISKLNASNESYLAMKSLMLSEIDSLRYSEETKNIFKNFINATLEIFESVD